MRRHVVSQPTLLLVDPDEGSRGALADLLRAVGYSVLEARDGAEGLGMARERLPQLVIADLWPFSGHPVRMVERLRGSAATARVPVLALTTLVAPEYRGRALAAGCAGYLEKPCPADRVLAEVRRILGMSPSMAASSASEAVLECA